MHEWEQWLCRLVGAWENPKLFMEEKWERLWYGKEEETSCGPCEGGKREALSLERKKRPVVEEEGERERALGLERKKRLVVEER